MDVITGLIKSNLPARICFQVSSRSDSRVVLDEMGADKLLGKGDMLFLQPGTSTLIRAQGTYASDEEITQRGRAPGVRAVLRAGADAAASRRRRGRRQADLEATASHATTLYEQAIEVVVREGRGSVSLLQRALGIGYGRAARLIDFMAEDGIVGDVQRQQRPRGAVHAGAVGSDAGGGVRARGREEPQSRRGRRGRTEKTKALSEEMAFGLLSGIPLRPLRLCGSFSSSRARLTSPRRRRDDAGDVVARALVEGELAQAVGALLHVGLVLHERQQLLVGDDAGQAVGAEQEAVAGLRSAPP